jgi:hypothetical protein
MAPAPESLLRRWIEAGLIDPATAAAIERWEADQTPRGRLALPIRLALALGAVLLAAGLLLFVSAHWELLAPGLRFALLLLLVTGLHGIAAAVSPSSPALSMALHGVGTVALGAGIFLAGQIFHLEAHWPSGLLLWALGAAIGWVLLRQWPQLALLTVLGPAWLASEWFRVCETVLQGRAPPAVVLVGATGATLLSLTYFSANMGPVSSAARRVLLWVGGLSLPVAALFLAIALAGIDRGWRGATLPIPLETMGWLVAFGMPLLLGWWLRRQAFWPLGVASGWLLVALAMAGTGVESFPYLWWALGAVLLVTWGVAEARAERIDMGAAAMAITVLSFYFSEVMDKLGRSGSLIGLGVLFLAGGWGLERLRRQLVAGTRRPPPARRDP